MHHIFLCFTHHEKPAFHPHPNLYFHPDLSLAPLNTLHIDISIWTSRRHLTIQNQTPAFHAKRVPPTSHLSDSIFLSCLVFDLFGKSCQLRLQPFLATSPSTPWLKSQSSLTRIVARAPQLGPASTLASVKLIFKKVARIDSCNLKRESDHVVLCSDLSSSFPSQAEERPLLLGNLRGPRYRTPLS